MSDRTDSDIRAAAVGAVAGATATVAMSALMVAAERTGLMTALPPQAIADGLVDRSPLEADRGERRAFAWLLHFGFGAATGSVYALLRRRLPRRVPEEASGIGFALAVWAASYLGWVPALRFLPPATSDEPGRPPVMVAAHVIFGAIVGRVVGATVAGR